MSRIEELEKRQQRLEKELANAKDRLKKQQETVTKKENELKQLEAEVVSTFLVENDLTLSDLKSLVAPIQSMPPALEAAPKDNEGGTEHV
ncbi:hypothetical protein A5819_003686 [Enterococcus sp. 7E2_DIV0204]|uniref:hypothetical protein n=1 Tax=unclassified Enterococcus TaxID=2608891 RepID=UPI000A340D81|nr:MULTISPECIES: hypothetical protein [unclassified Enterococcus]OTN83867.1 hypothetical protein A5819_003686 [Enterococcus sp. 7E2_DIV0204]OTP47569.1 hypothetical protein A5884_003540 [Enterococcus sp. 7D2_DIV0200]